jgi:hypothetical protein
MGSRPRPRGTGLAPPDGSSQHRVAYGAVECLHPNVGTVFRDPRLPARPGRLQRFGVIGRPHGNVAITPGRSCRGGLWRSGSCSDENSLFSTLESLDSDSTEPMTGEKLVVHYRSLLIVGVDWEESLEDAIVAVQADPAPVQLNTDPGEDALLHFLLYPASAHHLILAGEHIANALATIHHQPTTRIVLAACQPSHPPLDEEAVTALANSQLDPIRKKYAIRMLEPSSLQEAAEKHIRLAVRNLGFASSESTDGQNPEANDYSLLRYEARPWRL